MHYTELNESQEMICSFVVSIVAREISLEFSQADPAVYHVFNLHKTNAISKQNVPACVHPELNNTNRRSILADV